MRVVVTGAGALLGQGIIRALRLSPLDAEIIALDPSPEAVGLHWADRGFLIPMAADPGYLDAVRRTLRDVKPDVLLVGTDVELPALAAARAGLEAEFGTSIIASDERVTEIANDKWLTNQFLREHGFARPASCLPGDEAELIDQVGFPLIVKPRVGARSVGVEIVHNADALQRAIRAQPGLVVQECVASDRDEFTAGVLFFEKEPVISIVMHRDLRDGNTYRATVDDFPALNQQVQAIASALKPYGPANFQFRMDGDVVKVFEINSRFSGTTPLRARAGFNEVEIAIRHVRDHVPLVQPPVRRMRFLKFLDDVAVDVDSTFPSA